MTWDASSSTGLCLKAVASGTRLSAAGGLAGAQGGGGRLPRVTPWPGAGETLPVGVIWGGRRSLHSHYVLSNLSQFLPAWRLWLRRPGIHTATIQVPFNCSEKSAEPRDKTRYQPKSGAWRTSQLDQLGTGQISMARGAQEWKILSSFL